MSAAVYVRISDDREGTAAGVTRQRDDCVSLAADSGFDVVSVITDNDVSASRTKIRPGYAELIEMVERREVDVIVVWNVDRLYRRPVELERLIELVEEGALPGGIQVVTSGEIDLNSVSGRQVARILVATSRAEIERTSERIRRQQRQAAEEGRSHGGRRAVGYESGGMVVIESEATHLAEGVDRLIDGDTLEGVARRWNAAGFTTPTGKTWYGSLVKDALLSPRIAGLRVYRGQIVGPGRWPAIVAEAKWRRLRAVLNDPSRKKGGAPVRSLLAGLAVCGECGTGMTKKRRGRDNVPLYGCSHHRGCGRITAVAAHVDRVVCEAFVAAVTDPANLHRIASAAMDGHHASALDAVADRLAALEVTEKEYGAKLVQGEITMTILAGAMEELDRQRHELSEEMRSLSANAPKVDASALAALGKRWGGLDRGLRRQALEVVIDEIVVHRAPRRTGSKFDASRVEIRWLPSVVG